ncbi:MAG: M48 family metalloprotease [Bacteroidetes bacterium]|nr:M48 family metalloprotease [Bacteroidota bacterium]
MVRMLFMTAVMLLLQTSQTMRTTQPTNYLREGPGTYFNIVSMVTGGVNVTVLEKKGSWLKVKNESDAGWLSENSFAKQSGDKYQDVTKGKASSRASRAELAAAIKGFAKKYVEGEKAPDADISKYTASPVSAEAMEKFEHSFSVEPFRGYQSVEKPFDISFHEEAIGLGIAERIATEKGLVQDRKALLYVNLIGMYLSQFSRAYDLGFRFFILNDNKAAAYSCPGGYIFITKGMMNLCSNEAELAAVVAHEMSHVIQRHGLKEIHINQPRIKSEAAFEELEEEVGEEKSDDEKDLENYVDNVLDNLNAPRLLKYEVEADKLAMLYLKRAGYDPTSLVDLLRKFQTATKDQPDIFDDNYTRKDDMQQRLTSAVQFVRSEGYRSDENKRFSGRFTLYTSALR